MKRGSVTIPVKGKEERLNEKFMEEKVHHFCDAAVHLGLYPGW